VRIIGVPLGGIHLLSVVLNTSGSDEDLLVVYYLNEGAKADLIAPK
jgi:hypothetical protein